MSTDKNNRLIHDDGKSRHKYVKPAIEIIDMQKRGYISKGEALLASTSLATPNATNFKTVRKTIDTNAFLNEHTIHATGFGFNSN